MLRHLFVQHLIQAVRYWDPECATRWIEIRLVSPPPDPQRPRRFEYRDWVLDAWARRNGMPQLLEQVVLARNRDQHPDTITTMRVTHLYKHRRERGHLIFVSETERKMYADPETANIAWLNPAVHVSRELLLRAVEEVERLAEWLEGRMLAVRFGH